MSTRCKECDRRTKYLENGLCIECINLDDHLDKEAEERKICAELEGDMA